MDSLRAPRRQRSFPRSAGKPSSRVFSGHIIVVLVCMWGFFGRRKFGRYVRLGVGEVRERTGILLGMEISTDADSWRRHM